MDRNVTNKKTEKTAANNVGASTFVIMAFFSYIRTHYLSWSQSTPLPANLHDASATFQSWHEFNASVDQWTSVPVTETYSDLDSRERKQRQRPIQGSKFVLVTWNVDSSSTLPATRISAIISHVASSAPAVDVIFFQEVSRQALHSLLCDAQVRQYWYSSEADETNWHGQSFASMTLLSKRRFNHANGSLGPVWRYKYPSRFGRDALCCDVFLPSSAQSPNSEADVVRARLVNVHLDSLPIQPSQRPRQLSIVASVLRSANRGLVAGDFNPVLAEDATLISENHLIDAWHELHPDEPGFTWGVDGQQPFPPGRLDKVALVGMRPYHIEVMHPGVIDLGSDDGNRNTSIKDAVNVCDKTGLVKPSDQSVPWSDHSGLKCSVGLAGE